MSPSYYWHNFSLGATRDNHQVHHHRRWQIALLMQKSVCVLMPPVVAKGGQRETVHSAQVLFRLCNGRSSCGSGGGGTDFIRHRQ